MMGTPEQVIKVPFKTINVFNCTMMASFLPVTVCMTGTRPLANASRKKTGRVHICPNILFLTYKCEFFVEWASDIIN